MKVTILGTGTSQGIPVVGCQCSVCSSPFQLDKRLRSSLFIQTEEAAILIDSSPDLRQQLLNNSIQNIDAVLFTHEHNDHIVGFDDLRPITLFHKKEVKVFAEQRVMRELKAKYSYIFDATYAGALQVNAHEIAPNTPFHINSLEILPIRADHGRLPILGFRVRDLVYLTDVKSLPEASLEQLRDVKTLILNALQIEQHSTHLNLEEAIVLSKRIKAKQTYFTHISHRLGRHFSVNGKLGKNMSLAYDNLTFEL